MKERPQIILETSEERLWIGDRPVQLQPALFRLLGLFVERQGKLVTKRDILRLVWPDTHVSDASVKDAVKNLRIVLGDDATRPEFIETVRGRGYRFLGGVSVVDRLDDTVPDQVVAQAETVPTPSAVRPKWPVMVAGVVALAALFAIVVWVQRTDDPVPARPDMIALPIPEKPSLAVMPFANISQDQDNDWLSVGLSSNVIAAVASSPDIVVISQNALPDMADATPGLVAERYGVRYVLDGTIMVEANRLRVSARLTNALEGRTIWSDKWDRPLDDIFAIQDEISDAIFQELQVRLTIGEQARTWRTDAGSVENMRALVIGRAAFQTFTPDGNGIAAQHWGAMLDRDPDLPLAQMLQGWLHWHKIMVGLSTDPVADLVAAQEWGQKAIDNGLLGHPHTLVAVAANYLGQVDKALEYAEQGIRYAPGEADVVQLVGFVYATNGRLEEGLRLMQAGMRLEPDYPDWLAGSVGNALLKSGRWKEARAIASDVVAKGVPDENARFNATITLTVLSVWEGRMNEARSRLRDLLEIRPNLTVERLLAEPRYSSFITNIGEADYGARYVAALKEAGLG